jgi:hypothetical protein
MVIDPLELTVVKGVIQEENLSLMVVRAVSPTVHSWCSIILFKDVLFVSQVIHIAREN